MAGEVEIKLGANIRGFEKSLNRASQRLQGMGDRMQSIGTNMSKFVSLPLALAGGAAVKFATTFDAKAQEVRATAGLTAEDIDKIKDSVRSTAASTGQAMDDIFDATQKAVSGSLNLVESQALVERAAKASAAGFGEMERLVDVSTTAFDLFGDKADSAEQILDQIAKGAQNTQVNVSEMAGAFSRGASTAANLGVHQNELISILGVVSERFGDTQRGGRAVAEMLRQLQKPTKEAETIINQLFGSVDNLHENMRDDLIGTLQTLKSRLADTQFGLEDVVTSGQSLDAIQSLLSDGGERVAEVFGMQADAAGTVNSAFADSESFSRMLARAWNTLQSALIPVGETIIGIIQPALEGLVSKVQNATEWFNDLSSGSQRLIVILGGIAAAIGPVLAGIGMFTAAIGAALPAIAALTGPIGLVTAAVITLGVGVESQTGIISKALGGNKDEFEDWRQDSINAIEGVEDKMVESGKAAENFQKAYGGAFRAIRDFLTLDDAEGFFTGISKEARIASGRVRNLEEAMTFLDMTLTGTKFNSFEVMEAFQSGGFAAEAMAQKLRNAGIDVTKFRKTIELLSAGVNDATEEQVHNMNTIAGVQAAISEKRQEMMEAETQAERDAAAKQIATWEDKIVKMKGASDDLTESIKSDNEEQKSSWASLEDRQKSNVDNMIAHMKNLGYTWGSVNDRMDERSEQAAQRRENDIMNAQAQWELMSGSHKKAHDQMESTLESSAAASFRAASAEESASDSIVSAALDSIKALISKGVASVVANTLSQLAPALGPVAIPIAAGAGAAASSMLNAAIPQFAHGAVLSGETQFIGGEYPGASTNPEVVAPLDRLQGMIDMGNQSATLPNEIRIVQDGDDAVGIINRNARTLKRKGL